jgi:hypothetical protein
MTQHRNRDAARVSKMADTMAEVAKENGTVTRQDLIGRGFTPQEIDRHRDAAGARAATLMGGEV